MSILITCLAARGGVRLIFHSPVGTSQTAGELHLVRLVVIDWWLTCHMSPICPSQGKLTFMKCMQWAAVYYGPIVSHAKYHRQGQPDACLIPDSSNSEQEINTIISFFRFISDFGINRESIIFFTKLLSNLSYDITFNFPLTFDSCFLWPTDENRLWCPH